MGAFSAFHRNGDSKPYEMVEQGEGERDQYDLFPFKTIPLLMPSSKRRKYVFLLVTLCALFLFIWEAGYREPAPLPDPFPKPGPIPNIAHFVRQLDKNPDGTSKPLHYEFRHFMAYYSAHHYLKPDSINIWSDVTPELLADANITGDAITRAVLSIPNLKFHYVTFPNQTTAGVEIKEYAHKSDFVRTRMMAELGGQYFDDDAWVIRDMAVFRTAGFDNIFGIEWGGDVCQAMWMATPNNTLMNAFARLQETVFDGGWLTASNGLITNLVKDIRGYGHDRNALVLERNALFPGQWDVGPDGLQMYYKVHEPQEDPFTDELPAPVSSIDQLVANYKKDRKIGWRRDWRNTYVIHGYSNSIRANHAEWVFNPYPGFTPEYIISQKSNIGRALYPALKAAIAEGYIHAEVPFIPAPADAPPITTT